MSRCAVRVPLPEKLETNAIACKHMQKSRDQVCRMSRRETRCEYEPSWRCREYEHHCFRVKTARPMVDVHPPVRRPHVLFNAKRLQLERERQARILRDNFILLKKLREIMYRKQRVAQDTQRISWQESKCMRIR